MCPQDTRMTTSLQRVIRSTSCLVLGYRVFRVGGSNGAIYGSNKSKMAATAMLEEFQVAISPQPVVRSTSCFVLGWGFRGGGSNGAIFDSNKFKVAAAAILDNFEWPYLRNGPRSTYIARIVRVIFAIAQLSCYGIWCVILNSRCRLSG